MRMYLVSSRLMSIRHIVACRDKETWLTIAKCKRYENSIVACFCGDLLLVVHIDPLRLVCK